MDTKLFTLKLTYAAADAVGVSPQQVMSNTRTADIVLARRFVIGALRDQLGLSDMQIAWLLNKDKGTITYHLKELPNILRYDKHAMRKWTAFVRSIPNVWRTLEPAA